MVGKGGGQTAGTCKVLKQGISSQERVSELANSLAEAIADLKEEQVCKLVKERLDAGTDPWAILAECREGMTKVGDRYEKGDYFVSELVMAGEIFKQAMSLLEPRLAGKKERPLGRVVIGTVKGDIHDIGKNIVSTLLSANGFEVYDLGVDVAPERIVDKVKETDAQVVALSALVTISFDPMKETVQALEKANLRDKVKIMIGGGPVNEKVRAYTGADAVGYDAQDAISLAKKFVEVS